MSYHNKPSIILFCWGNCGEKVKYCLMLILQKGRSGEFKKNGGVGGEEKKISLVRKKV